MYVQIYRSASMRSCILGTIVLTLAVYCVSPASAEVLECGDSDDNPVEYDPVEAQCCGGNVYLKYENESCCTGVPYQDEINICCIDNQGVGHLDTRYWYDTCCNERAFDSSEGVCCGGWALWPRPEYNSCCSGWIAKHTEDIEFCCDIYPYPKDTYSACCGDIFATKHGEICCNGHTYSGDHICCGNHAYLRTNENGEERCCGNTHYNPVTQVCCPGDNIYAQVPNGKERCCGTKHYNPEYDICCEYRGDSGVYKKSDGYHGCCKTRGTRHLEMCCGGTLVDNAYTSCCTDRFWLDMYEHGKYPEGNMWWGKAFNVSTEFCCILSQDSVVILTGSFQEHCLLIKM